MGSENILLPEKWNEWTITEKIGQGSYGTVYKAKRLLEGRELFSAVKIIDIPYDEEELRTVRLEYDDDQSVREYFREIKNAYVKEIEVMFDLNGSPNIVTLEDFLVEEKPEIGWRIYIRMEYLEDFRLYNKSHEMTETEAIKLASDICNALVYCEKKNIIHRDVKPENILRSPDGDYKLGDFGIARAARQTSGSYSSKGTYAYMAPEVVKGQHYSGNADIYSLGIVLYRLMNRNRFPFENIHKQVLSYQEKEDSLNRRINGETFVGPVLASDGFSAVIMKACAYDPEQRYQTASEMTSDLRKLDAFPGRNENPQSGQLSEKAQAVGKGTEPERNTVQEKQKKHRPAFFKIMVVFLAAAMVFAGFMTGALLRRSTLEQGDGSDTAREIREDENSSGSESSDDTGDASVTESSDMMTVTIISIEEGVKEEGVEDTATEAEETTEGNEGQPGGANETPDECVYQVNTATLNVREDPDTDSKTVDVLKEGDYVNATGETSGNWVQIRYAPSDEDTEVTGWVSMNYLSVPASENGESGVPEKSAAETEPGSGISSAENTGIYEKYKNFIDPALDDFVADALNTTYLSVGQESKPIAAVWGDIICYSDDESVVTVSDGGKVTAVGAGQAHVVIISQTSLNVYEAMGTGSAVAAYLYIVS